DEVVTAAPEPLEGLLTRERRVDLVAPPREQTLDGDADGTLVVDDQDGGAHAALASGTSISTRKPVPGVLAAVIRPPCASTVRLAMARPSPVPEGLSEKNGSKSRGNASAGTPGPLSPTRRRAMPSSPVTATSSRRGPAASRSASRAFSTRFMITCR